MPTDFLALTVDLRRLPMNLEEIKRVFTISTLEGVKGLCTKWASNTFLLS